MFILVTTETANHLKPSETTRNQPEAIWNRPKPPRNYPKLSKTTRNFLQPTTKSLKLSTIALQHRNPRHIIAQRATNSYLVFLPLTLNIAF